MSPSGHKHYVPILKGKRGERRALASLDVLEKERLTPLIDVPPLEVDPETDHPAQTVDEALEGLAKSLSESWGQLERCFVDLAGFEPGLRLEDGRHPARAFFGDARETDLAAIPVVGLDRDGDYLLEVKTTVKAQRQGLALRLHRRDCREPSRLSGELRRLLAELELEPASVNLLLDFGEIKSSTAGAIAAEAEAALRALPEPSAWRSLTVCSGAFPESVSAFIKTGKTGELERRDWALWRSLPELDPPLPRLPAFGDYGVSWPGWLQFDPKRMDVAAKIVYADDEQWRVVRGKSVKNGYEQFRDLSKRLIRSGVADLDHCAGDGYIVACAKGGATGNLESWVKVATIHHLRVVDEQLASLP